MSGAKLVFTAFLVSYFSLKDMAPNYSKLTQTLFVHEQLLTVILVHFKRRRKRKHRFWVHNIIKKLLQDGAYYNQISAAS